MPLSKNAVGLIVVGTLLGVAAFALATYGDCYGYSYYLVNDTLVKVCIHQFERYAFPLGIGSALIFLATWMYVTQVKAFLCLLSLSFFFALTGFVLSSYVGGCQFIYPPNILHRVLVCDYPFTSFLFPSETISGLFFLAALVAILGSENNRIKTC